MKAILFSVFLFLLWLSSFGQYEKVWYTGIFVSPDYSNTFSPQESFIRTYMDRSFTGGLDFKYKFNKRLNLSIGILYSSKNSRTKESLVYSYAFMSPLPTPKYMYYTFQENYAELPIRIDVRITDKKFAPVLSTGISTNLFLYSKFQEHITFYEGGKEINTKYYYTKGDHKIFVNPQFQLGLGVDASFERSIFQAMPIFRMSILSADGDPGYFYYWYSVGLGLSYTYMF